MSLGLFLRRAATRNLASTFRRTYATPADKFVRIVEVGPRDGLQNEPTAVPKDVKVDLINRLGAAGAKIIEAGSFVSPKWVPQVPNMKGLDALLALLSQHPSASPSLTDEIAVFTAASDGFNKANTNSTVAESLVRLAPVVQRALENGLRVRGYVSAVISCPYDGETDPKKVRDVARELVQMGCYEVSLGDTVGTGTPASMVAMLNEVVKDVPVGLLANHDTFGMGISNVMTAVEDVVHALHGCGYTTGIDLSALVHVGAWISNELKRDNSSRAGKAYLAREIRAMNARPVASLA
ncbi:hypothetical protein FRC10_010031 [Ceratobasidium sp. 414]|nr:hypothetical protein FRC10_010031 [Ceratobasidium sp. 414]